MGLLDPDEPIARRWFVVPPLDVIIVTGLLLYKAATWRLPPAGNLGATIELAIVWGLAFAAVLVWLSRRKAAVVVAWAGAVMAPFALLLAFFIPPPGTNLWWRWLPLAMAVSFFRYLASRDDWN